MPICRIVFKSNLDDLAMIMANIPEEMMIDLDNKLPSLRRSTKAEVKKSLKPSKQGVDTGIYK